MPEKRIESAEKPVALIQYEHPADLPEVYATGARILVMSPFCVRINFFADVIQDDIAEETVTMTPTGQKTVVSKRMYEGPRHVKRKVAISVVLPVATVTSLAKVLSDIAKGLEGETKPTVEVHGD